MSTTITSNLFLGDYSEFSARNYLNEYFLTIEVDCSTHYEFLVKVFSELLPVERMLDYGCGPVIFTLFPAIPTVKEIHLVDYSKDNLHEVHLWLQSDPSTFDWSHFTQAVLKTEGQEVSEEAIAVRENLLRKTVTQVSLGDIRQPCPAHMRHNYDVVMSNYCLESVSTELEDYRKYLNHLLEFLKPQGTFILACVKNSTSYKVGEVYYQTCYLDEEVIQTLLQDAGFAADKITVRTEPFRIQTADHTPPGGVIFVVASR